MMSTDIITKSNLLTMESNRIAKKMSGTFAMKAL